MSEEYASFDDLIAGEEETTEVVLPSGGRVKVRGITRYQWMLIGKMADGDGNTAETLLLHFGMVAPALSREQVEDWRKHPGASATVGKVSDAIRDLSGLAEGSPKSDMDASGDRS